METCLPGSLNPSGVGLCTCPGSCAPHYRSRCRDCGVVSDLGVPHACDPSLTLAFPETPPGTARAPSFPRARWNLPHVLALCESDPAHSGHLIMRPLNELKKLDERIALYKLLSLHVREVGSCPHRCLYCDELAALGRLLLADPLVIAALGREPAQIAAENALADASVLRMRAWTSGVVSEELYESRGDESAPAVKAALAYVEFIWRAKASHLACAAAVAGAPEHRYSALFVQGLLVPQQGTYVSSAGVR